MLRACDEALFAYSDNPASFPLSERNQILDKNEEDLRETSFFYYV